MTEYTVQSHVGSDSVLHLNVPNEWADQDVTVTITARHECAAPKRNFAEALKAKVGGCSFDVPSDIHERKSEILTEIFADKYRQNTTGQEA